MTSIKDQERNLINLRRSRVSELLSRGYTNQAEIAKVLNVSEPTISRDVAWFREQARENFRSYLQEKLPEEFEKAINSFDWIIRKASLMADTTNDDRTRLQALHEVREARSAKMDLISNHDVMSYHVNKGKDKQKEEQEEQQQEEEPEQSVDFGSKQDYDSTSEEQEVQEEEEQDVNRE